LDRKRGYYKDKAEGEIEATTTTITYMAADTDTNAK
jgi:hypothetical protein